LGRRVATGLDIQDVGSAATRQVLRTLAGAVRATDQVVWENGEARSIGERSGNFPPLSFGELAAKVNVTGGPIGSGFQSNTIGAEGGFATHVVDVEVDTLASGSSRCCATPRSMMSARPSTRPMSRARCRAVLPRASAGR